MPVVTIWTLVNFVSFLFGLKKTISKNRTLICREQANGKLLLVLTSMSRILGCEANTHFLGSNGRMCKMEYFWTYSSKKRVNLIGAIFQPLKNVRVLVCYKWERDRTYTDGCSLNTSTTRSEPFKLNWSTKPLPDITWFCFQAKCINNKRSETPRLYQEGPGWCLVEAPQPCSQMTYH